MSSSSVSNTVTFSLEDNNPTFYLNGTKVTEGGNDITENLGDGNVDLAFNLEAGENVSSVKWVDGTAGFQWPNGMPSWISYTRNSDSTVTITDNTGSNPSGNEEQADFQFQVVCGNTTYTSPDPVIINKKPPE